MLPITKIKNKMKQTSVEWVFQELDNYYQMKSKFKSKKEILKQAKEMEKKQGYSGEEVIELLQKALTHKDDGEIGNLVTAQGQIRTANFHSWFNKFKNK